MPPRRTPVGFDTFDLELDLVVDPDGSWMWKDEAEYADGIRKGILLPEWIQGIERDKADVFSRMDRRAYPFDGSWRDWKPDPSWLVPRLPEGWEETE